MWDNNKVRGQWVDGMLKFRAWNQEHVFTGISAFNNWNDSKQILGINTTFEIMQFQKSIKAPEIMVAFVNNGVLVHQHISKSWL